MLAAFFLIAPVYATETQKMVAFGDSLTAGYGLSQAHAFPVQLERALRDEGLAIKVENAGVSGDTSTGGLQRLDWALANGADFVLLELGANDALRGIDPSITRKNLDAIITKIRAKNIPIFFTGMRAPPNMGPVYQQEFDEIFPELARKHNLAFYPFFLEGVAAMADLNQSDAIHPNSEGVAIIVKKMVPHLVSFIKNK
ncbi:arylesterase [Alphaproteobacteria bacterium 46_93_T64]|nr:arylesterase [Alphaproteobacteria bacterium 46_93_T64]